MVFYCFTLFIVFQCEQQRFSPAAACVASQPLHKNDLPSFGLFRLPLPIAIGIRTFLLFLSPKSAKQ
jgi:hypothetical protein